MANHQEIQSALNSFWISNFEQDKSTSVRILREVKTLLDHVLVELCKREPLLDFNPLSSSTVHQGKTSDILEAFLCLKNFDSSERELSIEDGNSPTGFAFAKLSSKKTSWDEFCIKSNSGKKYLSAKIISEKLHGHLKSLLTKNASAVHSSDFQINLMEQLEDNAVSIKFSSLQETVTVHVMPTIPCGGRWTFGANAWLSEESYWPSKAMKHEAIIKGIHLVGRSAPTKSPCQWQIVFLEPMRMFLRDDTNSSWIKCLEIFKLILNRSPLKLQKGITVFLLETVMLNLYKKFPQASFWREDKFTQRFLDFVEELRQSIRERKLHDFFLFDLNLLKDMDKSTAELCESELKNLVENPKYFLKDLESVPSQEDTSL